MSKTDPMIVRGGSAANTAGVAPTWWLVFLRELQELWVGGKAPILLLLYSIVLGFETYVTAYNVELSIMPPNEMVYETLKTAISVGLFIGLIIGADMISGERERNTFEALLLTPTNRGQVLLGKLLAALSPWPVALLLATPFMAVLGQGDPVFQLALPPGILFGTILAIGYTGLGMLVSYWTNSNRTSYMVAMGLYIFLLVPAQLPGRAQAGAAGQFLQWLNPIASLYHFLSKTLVNNRTYEEFGSWLISPIVFSAIVVILLFLFAAGRMTIEANAASFRLFRRNPQLTTQLSRAAVILLVAMGALAITFGTAPTIVLATAQVTETATLIQDEIRNAELMGVVPQASDPALPYNIGVSLEHRTVKTGDAVEFDTEIVNITPAGLQSTTVAMNIINLDQEGDVVDPEDWSPERTQYIETLASGEASSLSWTVNAILDGDYLIYMVATPKPLAKDTTSQVVASKAIHLTVTPFTRLNPAGVLPIVLGIPAAMAALIGVIFWARRRTIDTGAPRGDA